MSFINELERIGSATSARALRALDKYGPNARGQRLIARLIVGGNAEAWIHGNLAAALAIAAQLNETPQLTSAPLPDIYGNSNRLEQSAFTIAVGEPEKYINRFSKLALAETARAGQHGLLDSLRKNARVTGWQRELNADACELCQWWARDGRIWPMDHVMPTHPGCLCIAQPITK